MTQQPGCQTQVALFFMSFGLLEDCTHTTYAIDIALSGLDRQMLLQKKGFIVVAHVPGID